MVTEEEYAKLSMEVYAGNVPSGWEPVSGQIANSFPSGMYAQALLKTGTNEAVIVFRGTEGLSDLGDLTADAALTADGAHSQFLDALNFALQVRDSDALPQGANISVAGHSLDIVSIDITNSAWSEADGANVLDISITLQHTLAGESQVIRVDLPDATFDLFSGIAA